MVDAGNARRRSCPLLDHAPLIVLEIGRDGTILYANRTLDGTPVESVLGRSAHDLLPESARALSTRRVEEVFREGRTVSFEVRDLPLGGRIYSVRIHIRPIDEGGAVHTASVVAEDITERETLRDAVRWRLDGEELLVSIAGELIDVPAREVDEAVTDALRRVGVFAGAERIAVFSFSDDGSSFSHTHAWRCDAQSELFAGPAGVPTHRIPWIIRRTMAGEVVVIESPETLPPEASAEKAWLERIGMRSFVAVPVSRDGKVTGFLAATVREAPRISIASLPLVLRSLSLVAGNALRKKAVEEAARKTEERFRAVVEQSLVGIGLFGGLPPRLIFANQAACEILGYTREELAEKIARDPGSLVPLGDWEALQVRYLARFSGGEPPTPQVMLRIVQKDGSIRWIETFSSSLVHGEEPTVQLLFVDRTESHEAAEALRKSEEKYRTLAEASHDFIFVIDPDLRVAYVNSTAARFIGLTTEEATGKPFVEIFPEQYAIPFREAVSSVYRTGGSYVAERLFEKAGRSIWMTTTLTPIRNQDGTVRAVLGVSRDLTDRKKMEDELRLHRDELEELVRERTERLRSLERQQAEIERLASTGRMAARIAHEINNPLAAVRNSFLLAKDAIPSDHAYARYVPIILKEIDHISFVIKQMSTLHPTENEPPTLFSAAASARDIATLLHPMCVKRGVRLEVDSGGDKVLFFMSGGLLRQILYNLILNAIEASPPGGKVVTRLRIVGGGALRIEVEDEGSGIPEGSRAMIYEPFFTTKLPGETGGLGLGLPNVRAIVLAMNGTIGFQCPAGGGTLFRVEIPPQREGR